MVSISTGLKKKIRIYAMRVEDLMINRNRTSIRVNPLIFISGIGTLDVSQIAHIDVIDQRETMRKRIDKVEQKVTRWFFIEDTELVNKRVDYSKTEYYFTVELVSGYKIYYCDDDRSVVEGYYNRITNLWNRVKANG